MPLNGKPQVLMKLFKKIFHKHNWQYAKDGWSRDCTICGKSEWWNNWYAEYD